MYPDKVYELTNIPEGNAIMFGLSFGYADTEDVINQFDVGREELSTSVDFLG